MNFEYAVQIVWSEEDGAYLAIPAELPGCVADGQTQEEALVNLRQVIKEWIEVAREEQREIPSPVSLQEIAKHQEQAIRKNQDQIQKQIEATVNDIVNKIVEQQSSRSASWTRGGFYSEFAVEHSQIKRNG